MKKNIKSAKLGLIVSSFAVVIALINIMFSVINKKSNGSNVAIFCAMITIFIANNENYKVQKKRDNNQDK